MKKIFCALGLLFFNFYSYTQKNLNDNNFCLSISMGNFVVGKGYIKGIWSGAEGIKRLSLHKKKFLNKLAIGGEIYFENGADKATIYNPSPEQFMHDRYYHESNTGIGAKIGYYPFDGFLKGFHLDAGPLLVYSIRTYEKRAELIQYGPTLSIRMSEIGTDNKIVTGYRLTGGYDIYFSRHWLVGVRADFIQYSGRDLNSLWAGKIGYRFSSK